MEFLKYPIDLVLHFDEHLLEFIAKYDNWTYLILFLIIFAKQAWSSRRSAGDSLLFAAAHLPRLEIKNQLAFCAVGVAAWPGCRELCDRQLHGAQGADARWPVFEKEVSRPHASVL